MFPDFQYLLQGLLGAPMPEWLSIFKVFGFLMAMAFLAAMAIVTAEVKRKEREGLMIPTPGEITVKNRATGKEEKRQGMVYPHERMSTFLMIAAIGGIIGAKVFNAFETWEYFIQDPIGSLFSPSGLTFYGGLITATALLYFFARKYKIPFGALCDAAAPALMLGYGIGRLGCHFSGDGDWGIFNSAYITENTGALRLAARDEFQNTVQLFSQWFMSYSEVKNMDEIATIPHAYFVAPSWLPDWLVGMNYAHNVNHEGVLLPNCVGNYCHVLPVSVFPTALYEAITCALLFGLLWSLRKKMNTTWHLFGVYLILNGLERFFVEKIRVNYKYDWGFLHPTQAEIISTCLALVGIGLLVLVKKKKQVIEKNTL
jgi:phosphatidylglycerol:prolipoprotein diacylglycerol transferase